MCLAIATLFGIGFTLGALSCKHVSCNYVWYKFCNDILVISDLSLNINDTASNQNKRQCYSGIPPHMQFKGKAFIFKQ